MNKFESDILIELMKEPFFSQRALAEQCNYSLGVVNQSIKSLIEKQYLTDSVSFTSKALRAFEESAPKRAIILAAGFGMRMVPINTETPKALLSVKGEILIERLIRQLHEVGIQEIYVIVGFMKEKFEYLIDEFGVKLVVNRDYASKNNLHSLKLVSDKLENAYIVPCDMWCETNPFSKNELYSWYMVNELVDDESEVRVNRKQELVKVSNALGGNTMIGITYLLPLEASYVKEKMNTLIQSSRNDDLFWEETLYRKDKMILHAKVVSSMDVIEINTYEQLREFDSDSDHLKTNAIEEIAKALKVNVFDISNITVLKKGMTNRSFLFEVKDQKYIMRIPGEGTDQLINRQEEAEVYNTINGLKICDEIAYINPSNGYKITEYLNGARVCDPLNEEDVRKCMVKLKDFHALKLQVGHEFDIFHLIDFYESLWGNMPSAYRDYDNTKKNVLALKSFIDRQEKEKVLTHIDAVPDNFLFVINENHEEEIRLIDWEYAGMQDPHVDIAMFSIYAMYDREHIERLIEIYFDGQYSHETKIKIYCYIAACGLLWSNWCEYKRNLGVEFGEYSLAQYRYAKEYARLANKEMEKLCTK